MQSQVSESNEQKNTTQHPQKGAFKRFLLGYALVNICITAIILALLWQGLEQYETCTPERIAVALANRLEEGNLSDFETAPQLQSTPFATQQDRETKVREAVKEKSLYTLKGKEEHEYQICNDEGAIAKISIVPTGEKTWMGFQKYQIEQPEILLALTQQYKIQCPIGTEVLVNGETLGQEYQSGSEPIAGYQGISEQYTVPQQITYQLETMTEPTVEASLEGEACDISITEDTIQILPKVSQEVQQEIMPLAEQAAQFYARFITRDASFGQLQPYLLANTEYYKSLTSFYNPWYVEHDSYQFSNLVCSEFKRYSSQQISCEVRFDYKLYRGRRVHDLPGAYTFYYQKTEQGWKIANMIVL